MEHLKLEAPRLSFWYHILSREGNARHFRGRSGGIGLLQINLKAVGRGCASVIHKKRWNRRHEYNGKIDGFAPHIEYVNDKQIRC
jgi:hypothetical protein